MAANDDVLGISGHFDISDIEKSFNELLDSLNKTGAEVDSLSQKFKTRLQEIAKASDKDLATKTAESFALLLEAIRESNKEYAKTEDILRNATKEVKNFAKAKEKLEKERSNTIVGSDEYNKLTAQITETNKALQLAEQDVEDLKQASQGYQETLRGIMQIYDAFNQSATSGQQEVTQANEDATLSLKEYKQNLKEAEAALKEFNKAHPNFSIEGAEEKIKSRERALNYAKARGGEREDSVYHKDYVAAQKSIESIKDQIMVYRRLTSSIEEYKKAIEEAESSPAANNTMLRTQLANMRNELAQLTVEYRKLSEAEKQSASGQAMLLKIQTLQNEAAKLQDAYNDATQAIKNQASDTAEIEGMLGVLNLTASGMAVAQGAAAALGMSEEDLIAVQTNLQTALAASNFLQEAKNTLQKESAVMQLVTNAQLRAGAIAIELETAAKGKNIIVTYALTAAQKVFNAVAKGNPYLVLAAALITVVGAVAGLTVAYRRNKEEADKAAKAAAEQQKKAREATEMWANSVSRSAAKQIVSYKNLQKEWDKLGNNMNAKKAFIDKNQEAFNDLGWSVKNVVEAEKLLVSNSDNVVNAIMARAKAAAYQNLITKAYEDYVKSTVELENTAYSGKFKYVYKAGQDKSELRDFVKEQYGITLTYGTDKLTEAEANRLNKIEAEKSKERKANWEQELKDKEKAHTQYVNSLTNSMNQMLEDEKKNNQALGLTTFTKGNNNNITPKKEIESSALKTRQILLDLEDETTTKRIAQIHLNYDKEIAEVKKKEKELKEARGGQLTQEDNDLLAAMTLAAEANKAKALEDIRKEELQSMRDYLMEYGTLEQQRLAIAEEYAEKIAKAQTEGEKAALRVQQAQAEKDIQQIAFDKSFDWSAIFQDLQGHTVEYLTSLRDQLQDVLKNGGLDPEQMAIAQEKLRELNDEISRSGGIFDFVGSRQREQNRREQEAKDAKDAFTAALGEQESIEEELNLAKLSGASTDKILALEKQLADARDKTAKATAKANEAEDGAKRNAAQAVADWFADAQQFITEKGIDQLPELLNSIGLGSLGEKAAQGLSGFNNAAGAAADFASGNYIGAALKGINAVKDFGRMFGVGGGNAAEVQATIDRLTDRNELLTRAIEDLTEELEVNRGAMTMQAAQEAMRYQEEKNQNLKEIAQAQAGYHNAHHSWNSYWNGFSNEFVKEFSKRIGRSWSGDIWELTADEMDKLLSDPYAAELIKGTGKGGYGERVYEKLEDYAAEAEAIEEITKQLNETMTGMSFDGFYNSFIDNLMDMEKSAEDIFDDMAEYYQRAMLSRAVGEKMYEDLEKWYDKYAEAAKSGEGLTQAEIDELNREYKNLINEGIKKRDEIAKITGYGDTFKDAESAAARGIENITQDQANALEGIMTAQQIALEQGNAQRLMIVEAAQLMQVDVSDIRLSTSRIAIDVADIRDTQTRSLSALYAIRDNTSVLPAMAEDLSRMRKDINEMK